MSRAPRILFVGLLLIPAFAAAQAPERPKCFMTTSADPSGTKTFDLATSETALKAYLESALMCPSACYDTSVILTLRDLTLTIKVSAVNACAPQAATMQNAQQANRGCEPGQKAPALSLSVVGSALKLPPVKNRCDSTALAKIGSNTPSGAGAMKDMALSSYASYAAANADLSTPLGQQQSSSVLQAFGISRSEADALVKEKPDEAKTLLQAFASGDKGAVKEAASAAGVRLNDDTLNNIASLSAEDRAKNFKDLYSDEQKRSLDSLLQVEKTGFDAPSAGTQITDMDRAKCAIAKNESGSCGGNYSTVGPWTPKGRAYGKYQVMDFNVGSWTRTACGQAMTPYQFLNSPGCQEAVFEQKFGSLVDKCGSYQGAASAWFSGRCHITNSTDGYTSVGKYVSKFLATFTGTAIPFGGTSGSYTAGASPFGRVNPVGYGEDDRVVCTGSGCYLANWSGSSYPYPVSTGAPVSTGGTVSTGAPVSTGGSIATDSAVAPQPPPSGTAHAPAVATLIAQPQIVASGTPITISWSSVGMRSDSPCQLSVGGTFFAQGNEGTRIFDTKSIAASTTVAFSLQCLPQSGGAKIERSASVLVK